MSDTENPLMTRLRAGLEWPSWESWPEHAIASPAPVAAAAAPVNAAERGAEVQRRRARARTVDQGGPWLSLFDDRLAGRLAAEGGADLGPLAMDTFAVKGLVAIEGHVTTAGSSVRADAPPETHTAPIVTRLEAAGAVALGTVTMHEFAFGVTGVNAWSGTAPNPAALDRAPGGSSSGSASAVADGSASFAIGTDTGGSVRIPSAFCGIAGFKPAHGTYPADGVFPLSTTLDHVGFHAPTVADLIRIHESLGYPTASVEAPRRIGVARQDLELADDDVRHAIEAALDRLRESGAELVDVAWPDPEASFIASTGIMYSEASAIHGSGLAHHRDRYGADIAGRLDLGAQLTGPEVAAAHRLRSQLIAEVRATLASVDVIASPTVPIIAPLLTDAADPELPQRIVANTRLGNVVGLPALSVPAPTDGPPIGLQVTGAANGRVLGIGAWAESVLA
ncbi:MAG: amidase [Actinomycetota bacterium]